MEITIALALIVITTGVASYCLYRYARSPLIRDGRRTPPNFGKQPQLRILSGLPVSAVPIRGSVFRIGRSADDNHLIIDKDHVSRHHARIELKNSTYTLYDEESRNGVWVNNVRVSYH